MTDEEMLLWLYGDLDSVIDMVGDTERKKDEKR